MYTIFRTCATVSEAYPYAGRTVMRDIQIFIQWKVLSSKSRGTATLPIDFVRGMGKLLHPIVCVRVLYSVQKFQLKLSSQVDAGPELQQYCRVYWWLKENFCWFQLFNCSNLFACWSENRIFSLKKKSEERILGSWNCCQYFPKCFETLTYNR